MGCVCPPWITSCGSTESTTATSNESLDILAHLHPSVRVSICPVILMVCVCVVYFMSMKSNTQKHNNDTLQCGTYMFWWEQLLTSHLGRRDSMSIRNQDRVLNLPHISSKHSLMHQISCWEANRKTQLMPMICTFTELLFHLRLSPWVVEITAYTCQYNLSKVY